MGYEANEPYALKGNKVSEQAEPSTANRGAGTLQMRTLVELQLISRLLADGFGVKEDLAQMRQDIADEIT